MSALGPAGSTRRWRQIRDWIFARDGRRCRRLVDGRECGEPATTIGHKVRREHGGTDAPGNLQPECTTCNYGERTGARAPALALGRLTLAQLALARALDAAGLPTSTGADRAGAWLAAHRPSLRPHRGDLVAACRWRRERGPLTRL